MLNILWPCKIYFNSLLQQIYFNSRILSTADFYMNVFNRIANNLQYFSRSYFVFRRKNNFQTSVRKIHFLMYLSDKFRHFLLGGHISLITKYWTNLYGFIVFVILRGFKFRCFITFCSVLENTLCEIEQ